MRKQNEICLFFSHLLNSPNGLRKEEEFSLSPFIAGNDLRLCHNAYVEDGPDPEYFWGTFTQDELLEQFSRDNTNVSTQFIGTTLGGRAHYLVSVQDTAAKTNDYFSLISYEEGTINRKTYNIYSLSDFSITFFADTKDKTVQKILFPYSLIEDEDLLFF